MRKLPREVIAECKANLFGQEYPVRDWNPVALLVEDCDLDVQPNDTVPLHFSVPPTKQKHNVSCDGYVLRVDRASRCVVIMFAGLSKVTRRAIDVHFEQLAA